MIRIFALALLALALAGPARAAGDAVALKPGPGVETVERSCMICHTLNYIRMNSPFLTAKDWTAEVTKMQQVFGAPITDADVPVITEYLARNYGPAR